MGLPVPNFCIVGRKVFDKNKLFRQAEFQGGGEKAIDLWRLPRGTTLEDRSEYGLEFAA